MKASKSAMSMLGLNLGALVLVWGLILGGLGGWVWNIVKIVQSDFTLTGMFVARCIGVFMAPLGAVLGFF